MYHRNKVHTDEFWRYELARHRRTDSDSKMNEDMWTKQLGKHAEEANQANLLDCKTNVTNVTDQEPNVEKTNWMEAIRKQQVDQDKQSKDHSAQRQKLVAEVQMLALQSLHTSLSYLQKENETSAAQPDIISREGLPLPLPVSVKAKEDTPPPPPPPQEAYQRNQAYINLLATLRAHNDQGEKRQVEEQSQVPIQHRSTRSPNLEDLKEEPAAKRTQMWLAQLGQYQQKSLQEELDRNHDQLWEEQIARVKANPVKSPLEPEEIVIDDPAPEKQKQDISEEKPQPNMMFPLMSALEVHPPPLGFKMKRKPSATITRPPAVEEEPKQVRLLSPLQKKVGENQELPKNEEKKITLPLEHNLPELYSEEKETIATVPEQKEEKVEEEEPVSFLKSILLDRMSRKRPSLDQKPLIRPVVKSEPNDILRSRLLGLPPVLENTEPKPKMKKEDEPVVKKQEKSSYAHKSVLKHLLFRYNEEEQESASKK